MRATLLALVLVAAPPAPAPRTVGTLVLDGVPDVPARIAERTNQYQNTRGAALLDWDPVGDGILVSTRFAETSQLHRVGAPGAYREQLTFFKEPVSSGFYDPQRPGQGFWFSMDTGGGEFHQLWWMDRATGRATMLTDGKSKHQAYSVSRAGGAIAYAGTQRNRKDFDVYVRRSGSDAKLVKQVEGMWSPGDWSPDDSKLLLHHFVSINEGYLHVLDVETGETKQVNPAPGKKIAYGGSAFSGDGKSVFYSSDEDSDFLRLVRYDLATGKKEVLTPDLKWDVSGVAVSLDGAWLAWRVNEGGTTALWLAPASKPQSAKRVELPKGVIAGLAFDPKGRRLGFTMSTSTSTSDVYSVEVKSRKVTRWTFSEVGGIDPKTFVEPELVEFESFDGRMIPSWYYRPRGASGAKKVPVIVSIHGGPETQSTAGFSALTQYYVNELGAAVLLPNVRGSAGYGKSYLLLDNGMKREDSVKDIGALLDWLGTRPELDAARVAVMGASYGGYMTLATMTNYPDRVRCGVDVVGISSFVTFLENTEDYRRDLRRAEYGDERDPEMRKHLHAISPLTNAGKITKPLFVIQGKNDPRVPWTEAEQIVATVRKNEGTPVWYLMATDEGHGFQKKGNRDFQQNAMILFLEEFLLK